MSANGRISLIIASTSGGEYKGQFNTNMKLKPLKVQVMPKLGLDPSKAADYALIYQGHPLDEEKSLAELQIPDGSTLLLEPRQPEVI